MTDARVTVEQAAAADHELLDAMTALLPQLSSSAPPPSFAQLDEIATAPATTLFVARNRDGRVVGALTLAHFRLPTGVRAWIEDVVVDETERGSGIGSALIGAAVEMARRVGARTVDLTSRPLREEANRLYQRLGFVQRETNVYRFLLTGSDEGERTVGGR